jgi:hypothetical protein
MNDAIETFMDLFQGRTDAYGSWEGGCVRKTLSYDNFARHLYGEELIGVYPLLDNSTVMWGCSDIDVDDIDSARNLQMSLHTKGIPSFVERTVKGFHVWVFATEWVPAPVMRRAFLSAHEAIGLPPKEVNPKQEEAVGLGNYVRLPYPNGVNSEPEVRYIMTHDDAPMKFDSFLKIVSAQRVTAEMLRPLAEKYRVRQRATLELTSVSASVQEALDSTNGYIANIWRNGPFENRDRSNTLCKMVHLMHDSGVPMNYAYIILKDADRRWGKFHLRVDCVEQLVKIVEDIYGTDTTQGFRA